MPAPEPADVVDVPPAGGSTNKRLTSAQLGIQPASEEIVKARDEAILQAVKVRPWSSEGLLTVMPAEPELSPAERERALQSALVRLRVKGFIVQVDGLWRAA